MNLVWQLQNEKDFSLIFPSFGPSNKWTWKVMTESGFHVYFWRLPIFKWTLYKAGTFVFHQCNGVHFIEIALCGFLKDKLGSIKDTNIHYYFLFSKFLNIDIEGERGEGRSSNSQNNKTNVGGEGRGGVLEITRKGRRGVKNLRILSEHIFWMSPYAS